MEDSKTSLFVFNLDNRQNPSAETKRQEVWTVDGCLGTGASQDYVVGFHQLTILTSQGDIRELLVVSKGRAAFPKLWHFVSYDTSSIRVTQATTILDFEHLCQYPTPRIALFVCPFVRHLKVSHRIANAYTMCTMQ